MQACLDGKKIEYKYKRNCKPQWVATNVDLNFDWHHYDYRIKPEPMVVWVNIYEKNLYAYKTMDDAEKGSLNTTKKSVKFIEVIE